MGEDADLQPWLQAIGRGEEQALAVLYGRTSARLYAVLLQMLRRREHAEEVLHDTYIKVWHTAATFDPGRGSAMAWLVGIARHTAIDRMRRQRREVPLASVPEVMDTPSDEDDPLAATLAAAEARRLSTCLDELDPEPRACLRLAYWEGLTHEQLARRIERPVGTVKSWIRRSLQRLKNCLDA